jgi:hypothetical protein
MEGGDVELRGPCTVSFVKAGAAGSKEEGGVSGGYNFNPDKPGEWAHGMSQLEIEGWDKASLLWVANWKPKSFISATREVQFVGGRQQEVASLAGWYGVNLDWRERVLDHDSSRYGSDDDENGQDYDCGCDSDSDDGDNDSAGNGSGSGSGGSSSESKEAGGN